MISHRLERTEAEKAALVWFALTAAPGAGAKAVRSLQASGFDAYQPCETRWRYQHSKRSARIVPMLGSYLFAKLEPDRAIFDADAAEHISGIVCMAGRPCPVPATWVEQLRAAETRGEFDHTVSKKITFKAGQAVRVIGGMFTGHLAQIVTAKDGEARARILLKAMGGGAMTLPVAHLEAA